ncbi:fatty acid CoA ligase FadD9 [Actinokineospora baliensis]|uniref:carboxylic acid reductase n=1 Tax=Actinokineospora baliensis TaxID=547056 RepID=UPI001958D951|nr:carboxylic acid reductase [Actinokineospora baliensis]MBM7773290.1 fatty acid CoA ligase FadD9 [Actinokineospora baliensis]
MRLTQTVAAVMGRFADRPAVGERVKEIARDPASGRTSVRLLPRYETATFAQVWARTRAVATELWANPVHRLLPGERVAFLGFAGYDYTTLDLACILRGAVSVPLQTSAPIGQSHAIVAETEPTVVAASLDRLDVAVELVLRSSSVRRVLVFDYLPEVDDQRERVEAARVRLLDSGRDIAVESLSDSAARGGELAEVPHFVADEGDDPLTMLIYTSGSTGTPKGAMYTEKLVAAMFGGGGWADLFSDIQAVTFHYMPMSHVAGHSSVKNTLARGGISYFMASGDLSTFMDDIALARPTELSLVPRVCEMLYQYHRSEVDRRVVGGGDRAQVEAQVTKDMRDEALGGRIAWASCGSAPLSEELRVFIEGLLGLELHILYGATEIAGVSVDGKMLRPPVIDYKIVDVPELGYYRTDTPHPRGELLIKTDSVIPGYYKQPEVSATLFDADGYYKTGDIVAEVEPDRLAILDRRNSVLKLSQGEFVATPSLEATFGTSPLVRQIFVYGNSARSYLLAVVVPTPDALERYGAESIAIKERLSESFQAVAKEAGLNSYEIPREFLIEPEPFTQANGLLSDHRKLLRPQLLEAYRERLEALYSDITARESEELLEIRRTGAQRPVLETVQRAARALLSGSDVSPDAHFRDLGGDSLSAVPFVTLLNDIYGITVPVDMLISQATDLRALAEYIAAKRQSAVDRPTFTSVHGKASDEVRAEDLTLDKFLDARLIAGAGSLPEVEGPPKIVLLTGASGYLGRFLTLEWLRRLAPENGKLVCVVRGKDAAAARERLLSAYATGDDGLVADVEALSAHLEVLAGDMAEPRLGLDQRTWDRLADEVDHIVHAGALVNHVLPYNHLFEANVVGTAELIQLGITGKLKRFAYVSSVAVSTSHPGRPLDEDTDVRAAIPTQPVHEGYAGGYATSKWAGEVLLREAREVCGLPVTVFRSNMILAHSRYAGQLNVPDVFTRLLFSVLATGIAPKSFYGNEGDGGAHYDGLPVDFTAASIAELGPADGFRTYSLVNPHDDGISLDTIVDWLAAEGHRVELVGDYADWARRFESALRGLPEARRQYSALPLVHRFAEPEPVVRGSAIPSERFQSAVRDIPRLSREYIAKYAADLQGLLSA